MPAARGKQFKLLLQGRCPVTTAACQTQKVARSGTLTLRVTIQIPSWASFGAVAPSPLQPTRGAARQPGRGHDHWSLEMASQIFGIDFGNNTMVPDGSVGFLNGSLLSTRYPPGGGVI